MKIYTKRGDEGKTDFLGAGRVGKEDLRIELVGALDELNAALGWAASQTEEAEANGWLTQVQGDLLALGARLGGRETADALIARIEAMESSIDAWESELPPLKNFILPGGVPSAAALHWSRTVCRRTERRWAALGDSADGLGLRYLNRLSDLLFVMARRANRLAGREETPWTPDTK